MSFQGLIVYILYNVFQKILVNPEEILIVYVCTVNKKYIFITKQGWAKHNLCRPITDRSRVMTTDTFLFFKFLNFKHIFLEWKSSNIFLSRAPGKLIFSIQSQNQAADFRTSDLQLVGAPVHCDRPGTFFPDPSSKSCISSAFRCMTKLKTRSTGDNF